MTLRKAILSLYTLLVVCMGVATIIEKVEGKEWVANTIYGTWWFATLWGLLAVGALVFLIRRKVQRRMAVCLLHLSFVVMLVGALVTHLTSESGTVHLRVGEKVKSYVGDEGDVLPLPFVMMLTEFDVLTYPGTEAVMDYCCRICVKQGDEVEKMEVSMNNIGRAGGYRFYQSAYDSDSLGTRLLVAHDPYGIAITYIGYLMLLVSLLWTMCSRHTRIRQLYRIATKPLVLTLVLGLWASSASGADSQRKDSPAITPVSADIAHEFGRVVVLYNDRLCPVNTAATEFVTKLCGKPSWSGYSADEIFVSWMIYYTQWEEQKLIRIKSAEVQRMLGIDGKWASVRDFYTATGAYKLSGKANNPDLPADTRKAVREADEKIQVVTMFYNSEMLHMFPLTMNGRMEWYVPGSTELPLGVPTAEFQFINHVMDHLVTRVLVDDVAGAKEVIAKIKLYQREKAGEVMPSAVGVDIEVMYNSLLSARWVVFLCLTLSLALCLCVLMGKRTKWIGVVHLAYIILQTTYLSLQMVLRWVVSGHVPMSNGYETMLFMAWTAMVITVVVMRKIPVMKAFGPVVSSFCMLVSMLAVGSPQVTRLMPVLQSPLLTVHVALVMIAYALLAIITLMAVQGLVLAKRSSTDELARTTALSQLLLYPAVALLTMGIFVGAVWANVSWGTYWSWDPKETWALITMMIYALPLHRSLFSASPARYHLYILLSFLAVLMTYFGVNYFLSGMHSYA